MVAIPLIFVPPKYLFDSSVVNDTPSGVLDYVPYFEPWFRLFKGEDLNELVTAVNELIARLNFATTQRIITAAGNVVVALGDYQIIMNKTVGAATQVTLPNLTDFVDGGYNFDDIWVVDYKGDSFANPITVVTPDGATINHLASRQIKSNGAGAKFRALTDKSGWIVSG